MILFYQESTGDYLAVDTETNAYYREHFAQDHFEARATAIAGHIGSVCTTRVSREFLRTCCRPVSRINVPTEWLRAIGL